jgi:hypothetical protein
MTTKFWVDINDVNRVGYIAHKINCLQSRVAATNNSHILTGKHRAITDRAVGYPFLRQPLLTGHIQLARM